MNGGVIVITECPRCGTIKAARSKWADLPKDDSGVPIENGAWKFNVECAGCVRIEIKPVELSFPVFDDLMAYKQRSNCYAFGISPSRMAVGGGST
jgi:hypothetical protein